MAQGPNDAAADDDDDARDEDAATRVGTIVLDVEDLARAAGAPSTFFCPVSMDLMRDPVLLPTGQTYERRAIEAWLRGGGRSCPTTGQPVNPDAALIQNLAMRQSIEEWAEVHCPAIIDRATGKVRPIPEAAAAEAVEREDREPVRHAVQGAHGAGVDGRRTRGRSERSARAGEASGGGATERRSVAAFLRGVLQVARSAVGYERGSSSRYLAAEHGRGDGDDTAPSATASNPRSREPGIMYDGGEVDVRIAARDPRAGASSSSAAASTPRRREADIMYDISGEMSAEPEPSRRASGGFLSDVLSSVCVCVDVGGDSQGETGIASPTEAAASPTRRARRARRILARHGYNIRITPAVMSLYCCSFFFSVVICNDGKIAPLEQNPLIGGSKASMLGRCAHGHNGEHMRLRGQWWRLFTTLAANGGLLTLASNAVAGYVVLARLERRLGPYLLAFIVIPPLGGVAASAFFLPQQVSTGASSAFASVLGILVANNVLGNQPLQLSHPAAFTVGLAVYVALLGLAPFHDNFVHLFTFMGGLALAFVVLPSEMLAPRWEKKTVSAVQSMATGAMVIIVGLPIVWLCAIGDSQCGAGCEAVSCAGGSVQWWDCGIDRLCGGGVDVAGSVCSLASAPSPPPTSPLPPRYDSGYHGRKMLTSGDARSVYDFRTDAVVEQ